MTGSRSATVSRNAELERFVRDLNAAWVEGRVEELNSMFHEHVVALPPGGGERVVGREAMVESFRQFLAAAVVHRFEILELHVDDFGETAVATLKFEIDYEMQGEASHDTGTDILILGKSDGAWRVVWRTQLPGVTEASAP